MNANAAVLVLDVDFQPLRIDHWRRAAAAWMRGKIEIVEYSADRTIKGVTTNYPMPSVVRVLTRFRRDRQAIRFSRLNIYARDAFTCQYCFHQLPTEELTFDHVMPRSRGGKTSWDNIVTCCIECNSTKAARTPAEAGMHLRRQPKKPRWLPVVNVDMDMRRVPEEWRPYWSATLDR